MAFGAIQWSAWDYGSGQGLRVGIQVDPGEPSHGSLATLFRFRIWTDNEFGYSGGDQQFLNYGGVESGSFEYENGPGDPDPVLRDEREYAYTYPTNSYGTSPANVTVSVSISGAYAGQNPSKSVTTAVPPRPFAAPAAPTAAANDRVNDSTTTVSWTNHPTAGEPYDNLRLERSTNGAAYVLINGNIAGNAGAYNATNSANAKYNYRVRAENSVGVSAYDVTTAIFTSPSIPTSPLRTGPQVGAGNQVISWNNNNVGYSEFSTEVWGAADGVYSLIATVAGPGDDYTHVSPSSTVKRKYKVRHRTTAGSQGVLYSAYSAETTETTGALTAPNPPTNLAPKSPTKVSSEQAKTFTWTHNPTDTTAQNSFEISYRIGVAGYTTVTVTADPASNVSQHTFAAGTFDPDVTYNWRVRTKGTATSGGPTSDGYSDYSASATFVTVGDPNEALDDVRAVMVDITTGEQSTAPQHATTPIGFIGMFGGGTAPAGWLLCNGATFSGATYPELEAVLGGTTLPDLRDRFPIGASGTKALHSVAGSDTATIGVTHLPSHDHAAGTLATATDGAHNHDVLTNATDGASTFVVDTGAGPGTTSTGLVQTVGSNHSHDVTGTTATTGSGTALPILNKYRAVNFIIKAT